MSKLSFLLIVISVFNIISCGSLKSDFAKQKYTHLKKGKAVYVSEANEKLFIANAIQPYVVHDSIALNKGFVKSESSVNYDSSIAYLKKDRVILVQSPITSKQETTSSHGNIKINQAGRRPILLSRLRGDFSKLGKADDDNYKLLTVFGTITLVIGLLLLFFLIFGVQATELWMLLLMVLVSLPIIILGILILKSRTNEKLKVAIKVFLILSLLIVLLFRNL
jgi:hypothetical protein